MIQLLKDSFIRSSLGFVVVWLVGCSSSGPVLSPAVDDLEDELDTGNEPSLIASLVALEFFRI